MSEERKHTSGRLEASGRNMFSPSASEFVATAAAEPFDQGEVDARRLAACWNACEGISTEGLETGGMILVLEVIAKMSRRDNLPDDVAYANMLRDERLEEEADEYEPEQEECDDDDESR